MKAVVFAYHDVGCEGLEALLRHGVEIPFVITHQDDPGENTWFRSVAQLAASHGIPVQRRDEYTRGRRSAHGWRSASLLPACQSQLSGNG